MQEKFKQKNNEFIHILESQSNISRMIDQAFRDIMTYTHENHVIKISKRIIDINTMMKVQKEYIQQMSNIIEECKHEEK